MQNQAARCVKVLSIRQPHADEIIFGRRKWAENRTWRTNYRGELYIHASRWDGPRQKTPGRGVVGAIIGKVKLVDVVDLDEARNEAEELRLLTRVAKKHGLACKAVNFEHVTGPVCFILAEPEALPRPIPALGKLNLWTFRLPS